jgi:DNA repair helicase Rad3
LIFLPYNFLLDKSVRDASGIDLKGAIVILDEAHNVESSCQDAASTTIREDELTLVLQDLNRLTSSTQGIIVSSPEDGHVGIQLQKDYQIVHGVIAGLVEGLSQNMGSSGFQHQEFDKSLSHWEGEGIVRRLKDVCGLSSLNHESFSESLKKIAAADKSFKQGEQDPKTEMPPTLSSNSSRILSSLDIVLSYLFAADKQYYNDYRMAIVQKKKSGPGPRQRTLGTDLSLVGNRDKTLEFWCMNPAIAFDDLVGKMDEEGKRTGCRTILLASGTLAPLDSFQSELGAPFAHKLEANHVISSNQVFCGVLGHAPLDVRDAQQGVRRGQEMVANYKNCDTYGWQDGLGQALLSVLPHVPGGSLVFLPSYSLMDKLLQRWQSTGLLANMEKLKQVFQEPRSGKEDVDSFMSEYRDVCRNAPAPSLHGESSGAVMFAIYRGKMSEGIDFSDDQCRLCIAVGIPFPHFKDLAVQEKRAYNNKYTSCRGLLSGNDWYETQAYRALNQALGRCIRHRTDWGAVLLYDARYLIEKNVVKVSKWIRKELRPFNTFEDAATHLKDFMQLRIAEPILLPVTTSLPSTLLLKPEPEVKPDLVTNVEPMEIDPIPAVEPMEPSSLLKSLTPISSPQKTPKMSPFDEPKENLAVKPRVNLSRFNFSRPNPDVSIRTPSPIKPSPIVEPFESIPSIPTSVAPTRKTSPIELSSEWLLESQEIPMQEELSMQEKLRVASTPQFIEKVHVQCGACHQSVLELAGPALSLATPVCLSDGYIGFSSTNLGHSVHVYTPKLDYNHVGELKFWSKADKCFMEEIHCTCMPRQVVW